jgi:hypothetical protein
MAAIERGLLVVNGVIHEICKTSRGEHGGCSLERDNRHGCGVGECEYNKICYSLGVEVHGQAIRHFEEVKDG